MVRFADRMDLLKGSAIRELLALANKPDIISFAGGMFTARSRSGPTDSAPAAAKEESSGIVEFIRCNKRFSVFLLGVALLFAIHSLINNFIILVVQNVGGDSSDMSR